MHEKYLEQLLQRSFEMYNFMAEHISELEPMSELRYKLAFESAILCFQHGLATLTLISQGLTSSGLGLLRPQYESLIRGLWFIHANNENWLTRLSNTEMLTPSELKKLETPMIADMLKALDNSDLPPHMIDQLNEFRVVSNSSMNSFTHSGLLSIISSSKGYDPKLIYDAIRNANAVAAINIQMLSLLTGIDEAMEPVREMHSKFIDCLPITDS